MNADPSDPKQKLLNDTMAAAVNQRHAPGLPLHPFAALMIKVADEASETVADLKAHITRLNQQNTKLQKWVLALAIAALVSAVVQTAVALYSIPSVRAGAARSTETVSARMLTPSSSQPGMTNPPSNGTPAATRGQ